MKLSVESYMYMISAELYDSDGNVLSTIDNSATSGYCTSPGNESCHMEWNDTIEKFKGSVFYSVSQKDPAGSTCGVVAFQWEIKPSRPC